MSKSLLLIDTPESCEECPLKRYSNLQLVCTPMNRDVEDVECPLKPLPKKKIVLEHRIGGYTVNGVKMTEAHGWNECIDAIAGETE